MVRTIGFYQVLLFSLACYAPLEPAKLQDGDLIFQTSTSRQSLAIQLATNSPYSHMGIIYRKNGRLFVFEAVGPVKLTPLSQWIKRGQNQAYVVKRLKKPLVKSQLKRMKRLASKYIGKPYDIYFGWSDKRIYCSELVWKLYKEAADIEIGSLRKLKDFDLEHPAVKKIMRTRYGKKVPLNEPVIAPSDMFESEKLATISTG